MLLRTVNKYLQIFFVPITNKTIARTATPRSTKSAVLPFQTTPRRCIWFVSAKAKYFGIKRETNKAKTSKYIIPLASKHNSLSNDSQN